MKSLKEKLEDYKEYANERDEFHEAFSREEWHIVIPKPRFWWRRIKMWYFRKRYRIPPCCIIIARTGSKGFYRYCELAIMDTENNSQRHPLRCPEECGKCKDEHQDLRGYDE